MGKRHGRDYASVRRVPDHSSLWLCSSRSSSKSKHAVVLMLVVASIVSSAFTSLLITVHDANNDATAIEEQSSLKDDVVLSQTLAIVNNDSRTASARITAATAGCPLPDMTDALFCLGLTTSNAKNTTTVFEYPSDAVQHFKDIHAAVEKWTNQSRYHCTGSTSAGQFCGPWIENYWIMSHHFHLEGRTSYNNQSSSSSSPMGCLSNTFGPYIPLLIPWVDLWLLNTRRRVKKYPRGFISTLQSTLRPNVLYITVSQNDEGLLLPGGVLPSNILVLSAGGYGHVPIPLLKQEENVSVVVDDDKNDARRKWLVSYVGSLGPQAPTNMRQRMHEYFVDAFPDNYTQFYQRTGSKSQDTWRSIVRNSYLNLAPRGFGRTSYHFMEILQMGRIPIHVHLDDDVPWVPYYHKLMMNNDTLGGVAYSTTVEKLPALCDKLRTMTADEVRAKEKRILQYRDSHFTFAGVLHQIDLFMTTQEKSDLECVPLPRSIRGAGDAS